MFESLILNSDLLKSFPLFLATFRTFWYFLLRLFVNHPEICFFVRPVSLARCSLSGLLRQGCSMLSRNHFWRIFVWALLNSSQPLEAVAFALALPSESLGIVDSWDTGQLLARLSVSSRILDCITNSFGFSVSWWLFEFKLRPIYSFGSNSPSNLFLEQSNPILPTSLASLFLVVYIMRIMLWKKNS